MPLRLVDRKALAAAPDKPAPTVTFNRSPSRSTALAAAPDKPAPTVTFNLSPSRSTATFGNKEATFSFAPSTRASQRSKSSVNTSSTSSSSNEVKLRRRTPPPASRKGRPVGVHSNFAVGDEVDYLKEPGCWVPTVVKKVGPSTGLMSVATGAGGINPDNLRARRRPDLAQLLWVRRTLLEGRLNVEAEALFSKHAAAGVSADSPSGVGVADGDPVIAVETLKHAETEPKDAEPTVTIEAGTRGVLKERTREGDLRINWGASLGQRRTPCRHARKVARLELPSQSLAEVGAELEELLGVSGCVHEMKARARHEMQRRGEAAAGAAVIRLDDIMAQTTGRVEKRHQAPTAESMPPAVFREVFWELLMAAHSKFGLELAKRPAKSNPDDVWEDYIENEELSRGPYGSVHLSQHKPTGSQLLVKKILWRQANVSRAEVVSQLERLSSCDHSSVAKLLDHFQGPPGAGSDLLCLAVAHYGGLTLEKALPGNQQVGELPHEIVVLRIMRQMLGAVSHMHVRGLLHLALACSNIVLTHHKKKRSASPSPGAVGGGAGFLSPDWPPHVYVMDFGLASIFNPEDGGKRRNGTSSVAPELAGGVRTPPADVFGCGAIFFRLLTLKAPHEVPASAAKAVEWWRSNPYLASRGQRIGDTTAPRHAGAASDCPSPPAFFRLCDRMLAKHRHDRPTVEQCLREASFV